MSDTKEYIKGDKHVHQAGSVMIKFVQYNMPGQQAGFGRQAGFGQQDDWSQSQAQEAEEAEKEFAEFEEMVEETDGIREQAEGTDGSREQAEGTDGIREQAEETDGIREQAVEPDQPMRQDGFRKHPKDPSPKTETNCIGSSVSRRQMAERMLDLVDKGDWVNEAVADGVSQMMIKLLNCSEDIWQLLESGRGDRVKVVLQNMIGYLADKKLLKQKSTPALNRDFFGDEDGYSNIDKGRPSRPYISSRFRKILPILDRFVPHGGPVTHL